MRDPIDELSNFDSGTDVNPLPPSEIRRRGDRLRRRNHLLAATGAAAVVALIIAPLAVLGAQRADDTHDPAPAPSPTATPSEDAHPWPTRIPDNFPLTSGMPEGGGTGEVQLDPPSRDDQWLAHDRSLQACGQSVSPGDPVDWLTTRLTQGSSGQTREIQLFTDDAAAAAYVDAIRQVFEACPEDDSDAGDALGPDNGTPPFFTITVKPASLSEDSLVITSASDGVGQGVIHAIRVGNAVLVESAGNEGPGGQVDSLAVASRENLADVVAAMNGLQSTTPTPTPDPEVTGPAATIEIPPGFPLDAALDDSPGEDATTGGPGRRVGGVSPENPCGVGNGILSYQAPDTDRLGYAVSDIEKSDRRTLLAFPTVQDAVDEMTLLERQVANCDRDRPEGALVDRVWRVFDADTGYDSSTFGWTYEEKDGFGAPSGSLYTVVRIGNAVLAVERSAEGGAEAMADAVSEQLDLVELITQEMCVFTVAGC